MGLTVGTKCRVLVGSTRPPNSPSTLSGVHPRRATEDQRTTSFLYRERTQGGIGSRPAKVILGPHIGNNFIYGSRRRTPSIRSLTGEDPFTASRPMPASNQSREQTSVGSRGKTVVRTQLRYPAFTSTPTSLHHPQPRRERIICPPSSRYAEQRIYSVPVMSFLICSSTL